VAGEARGPGELAGREQELAELRGRRAAALAGHGALALVTGPPGIGKTRLAEELAGQARQDGHRVLWGRGVEDQGAPPLWMWRRILGAVGGDDAWGQLTGDAAADGARSDDLTAARYRAAAAAADAITAAADQDGLLVVLEDLHWADQASLFLLRELAAELPQSRLLVLATSREATDGPARAALGDLARLPGLHMLRLGALDEAALAGILRAAGVTVTPELARVVRAHAGGNPLYVTTLARLLVTEPGGPLDEHTLARIVGGSAEVSGLVRSLLRDLDDEACAVLAAASVLGEAFDPALVAAVGPESAEVLRALAAAEHRGLASPSPGRPGAWRFTHALVRDGIYAGIPEDQRIGLHQRAAAALEPLARRAPGRGGEVATHLLRAAPGPAALRRAARWATAAADAATRALAFEDAAAAGGAAADGAGADGAGAGGAAADGAGAAGVERAALLIELATAEYRAGRFADSLAHSVAAADAAGAAGRLDLVAAAALVVRGVGHPAVAATLVELCDRALAGGASSGSLRARLLAQRAAALAELGDLPAAAAESAAAMAAAEGAGDPVAELDAIRARAAALAAPEYRAERLRLGTRAVELATLTGQPLVAVLGRVWRIDAAYALLNLDAVDVEISQIAQLADATRLPLVRWHLLRQQASRAALDGRLGEARDRSWAAYRLALRLQDPSGAGLSYAFAVWLAVVRGEAAEIPADFLDVTAGYPPIAIVQAGRARALFALGRPEEARAVYETLRSLPGTGGRDTRILGAITQILDLIIAFRDYETARATYDLMATHTAVSGATGTGVVFLSGSLHWPLGRLAALLGRTEQALEHYATAVTVNTRLGARPFVVLTRLDWAGALSARGTRGDHEEALPLARQAAEEARRLDMPGPARRGEQLISELRQALAAGDPLTPREREIAGLISGGLTNRAIAGRLVLSERTVEGHVRNILAKLQLANRTELAAWAMRAAGP
jgi:DNA-binding CsgD family transcriptional regulator